MPIYEHECPEGHRFESVRKFDECGVDQTCPKCGRMAKQIISGGGLDPWQPFYCETQGRYFETRSDFKKYCRKKGLSDGITRGELNFMKEEARHMRDELHAKREAERLEAQS